MMMVSSSGEEANVEDVYEGLKKIDKMQWKITNDHLYITPRKVAPSQVALVANYIVRSDDERIERRMRDKSKPDWPPPQTR